MEIYFLMRPGSLVIRVSRPQTTKCPWEDIYEVTHDKTPTKTLASFVECVMFHLQQVFRHDTGKALKYYITNTLRKPNHDSSVFGTHRTAQQLSRNATMSVLQPKCKSNHQASIALG